MTIRNAVVSASQMTRRSRLPFISLTVLSLVAATAIVVSPAFANQPKFEPEAGTFPVTFVGVGPKTNFRTVSEGSKVRVVTCGVNTLSGEYLTATSLKNLKLAFTGCTGSGPFGLSLPCSSTGGKSGEVTTSPLKGKLVYLRVIGPEAGIDLEPESPVTPFAEMTCGGIQRIRITGSVIGQLTPINSLTSAFTLTFSQVAGQQVFERYFLEPSGFCVGVKSVLTASGSLFENFSQQMGLEGSETVTFSKRTKVAATAC